MIYTVFSTSHSPYMQWQSELLEYTWKKVEQPGRLIRLLATDDPGSIPKLRYAETITTQPWEIHPETKDHYPPYNKPASLLEWFYRDEPDGTVLFIDPDCVFRAPIEGEVEPGNPLSQTWVGFPGNENGPPFGLGKRFQCLERVSISTQPRAQGVMIPTLIHTKDLRRICARWLELITVIRRESTGPNGNPSWESDMFGYVAAAAEYGLVHEPANLGICTNWRVEHAPDAPMIHYCAQIKSEEGELLWGKRRYRPWERVDPSRASLPQCREFLTILDEFANTQPSGLHRSLKPRRSEGVREGRILDEIVLIDGKGRKALSLNHSSRAIWELCDGSRTVAEISRELQQRYACKEDDLYEDLTAAIDQLQKQGVLRLEPGQD